MIRALQTWTGTRTALFLWTAPQTDLPTGTPRRLITPPPIEGVRKPEYKSTSVRSRFCVTNLSTRSDQAQRRTEYREDAFVVAGNTVNLSTKSDHAQGRSDGSSGTSRPGHPSSVAVTSSCTAGDRTSRRDFCGSRLTSGSATDRFGALALENSSQCRRWDLLRGPLPQCLRATRQRASVCSGSPVVRDGLRRERGVPLDTPD